MASHRQETKSHRVFGTIAGVCLAIGVLPGIGIGSAGSDVSAVIVASAVFIIVNQLIYSYPNSIRTAPPVATLVLAVVGFVQDALAWLLVSWLASQMGFGVEVDGVLAAVLGGLVVRTVTLAALALAPGREAA
ncbi:hypothetical protein [Streptomyces uncialis]|uniref:hypothetical protein n=1 Tax=Streptomyces uncialis TaxID=1048205 RepID=UPI0037BDDA2F